MPIFSQRDLFFQWAVRFSFLATSFTSILRRFVASIGLNLHFVTIQTHF